MKKITLSTVKNSLKRDELRNVKGGSGNYACQCARDFCNWLGMKTNCYDNTCCFRNY